MLTDYCAGGRVSPLFIHAAGGMGKSALLARFVLQERGARSQASAATWRPFVYIDFDRPELDATNLAGVLLAIVRQLGPQVPGIAKAAQALHRRHGRIKRKRSAPAAAGAASDRHRSAGRVRSELVDRPRRGHEPVRRHPAGETPIVMIFDTLEEVQFSNPDALAPLVSLVGNCRKHAPQLRPILAGRVLAEVGSRRWSSAAAARCLRGTASERAAGGAGDATPQLGRDRLRRDRRAATRCSLRLAARGRAARSGDRRSRDRGARRRNCRSESATRSCRAGCTSGSSATSTTSVSRRWRIPASRCA